MERAAPVDVRSPGRSSTPDPDKRQESDQVLVGAYARSGSDSAFHDLVRRHVNLVYGTAFRQLGNGALAEEVTQNVFVALARKAPRLAGHATLAGWLHRTAVLEAKACLRSELRRCRREEAAAAIAEVNPSAPSSSIPEDLRLLLDEALLDLRAADRLALVLRYFEDRTLREVGAALGVPEDAARKRVDRALERLTRFFQTRGYAVPASVGAACLGQAAQAAPAGLASVAAAAGLAAAPVPGFLAAFTFSLMTLTKTQTAVLVMALCALPTFWQEAARARAASDRDRLQRDIAAALSQSEQSDAAAARLASDLAQFRDAARRADERFSAHRKESPSFVTPELPRAYRWDDSQPVARVPKNLIAGADIDAVRDRRGLLNPEFRDLLRLTDAESVRLQSAIDRFYQRYQELVADRLKVAEPEPADLEGHDPSQVRVFEVKGVEQATRELQEDLKAETEGLMGTERSGIFHDSLTSWMPMTGHPAGMTTGRSVFVGDHRIRIINVTGHYEDRAWIRWSVAEQGLGSMSGPLDLNDIPPALQPHIRDWVEDAKLAATRSTPESANVPGTGVPPATRPGR